MPTDTVESITEYKAILDKADALVKVADNLPADVAEISKNLKVVCEKSLQFMRVSVRAKACMPVGSQLISYDNYAN